MSVSSIIEALGGQASVASRLQVSAQAINNWCRRGVIPRNRTDQVIGMAVDAGIDLKPEDLNQPQIRYDTTIPSFADDVAPLRVALDDAGTITITQSDLRVIVSSEQAMMLGIQLTTYARAAK